jgi:hypothetical protein
MHYDYEDMVIEAEVQSEYYLVKEELCLFCIKRISCKFCAVVV